MSCPVIALSPTRLLGSLSLARLPWAGWACPPAPSTLDRSVPLTHGFHLHSGSARGGADSLNSGYYGAMFSICARNGVGNTGVRFLCCWAALAQYRQHRGWSAQELGRTHTWDRWPQLTKRISPHDMVYCSAYRALEKRRGTCPELFIVAPSHSCMMELLLPLKWLNTCMLRGISYSMNFLFCFSYYIVFIPTQEFFYHFYPSDSLLYLWQGEWASDCVGLSCQLG